MEALGVDDPALDAEVVALEVQGFRDLRLTDFELLLDLAGRQPLPPQYRELLVSSSPSSTWTRTRGAGRRSTRCGCSTTTARGAGPARRRPADGRPPVGLDQGALRRRPPAPDRPRRDLDRGAEAGARAGLLHEDDVRVRAPRAGRAVGDRRRRPLRRAVGGARRPDVSGIGYAVGVDRTLLAVQAEGLDVARRPACRRSSSRWAPRRSGWR